MAVVDDIMNLRNQGLSDNLVIAELSKTYSPDQVQAGMDQADNAAGMPPSGPGMEMPPGGMPLGSMQPAPGMGMPPPSSYGMGSGMSSSSMSGGDGNIYERIEEITESMIDEKWDELISEVKKIVQWKEQVEEKQAKMLGDIEKLKEDFKVLHQGVLGKLEGYDTRMKDVGSELKAVGKVFKDVIPEFVENVKELKHLKNDLKSNLKQG